MYLDDNELDVRGNKVVGIRDDLRAARCARNAQQLHPQSVTRRFHLGGFTLITRLAEQGGGMI